MSNMISRSIIVIILLLRSAGNTLAWSISHDTKSNKNVGTVFEQPLQPTRRAFVSVVASSITLLSPMLVLTNVQAAAAAATTSKKVQDAIDELQQSRDKLKDIPELLEQQEWEKVRGILKVPPVNKLWNLGDSQNTVLVLAKETGNIDLFELKDDLAYNLQICDQLTYDNAFVYFQPGNGKYKIKEPQQLATMAMKQIQQIIDLVSSES